MKSEVKKYSDLELASRQVADDTARLITRRLEEQECVTIVLSGGSTPRRAYTLLGGYRLDWQKVWFFPADERCVPRDDALSNYLMIKQAFRKGGQRDVLNLYRVKGELGAATAAREYREAVAPWLAKGGGGIDLALLGIGGDGHIASLFPGSEALADETGEVVSVDRPGLEPMVPRVSLSLGALNRAAEVWHLFSTEGKEAIVRAVRDGSGDYPFQKLSPRERTVFYLAGER